ncbi:MAG: vitamin K epoxide reductase family protein [Rudaea sp.]
MNRLNWIITGLAGLGLLVATYLITLHYNLTPAVCLGVGDCEIVNKSIYSELFGIPVAILGAGSYVALIVLGLAIARDVYADYARLLRFFIGVVGVAFSAYLTYIELYVLHQICPWCVFSAIIITLITILSFVEYRSGETVEIGEAT